MIGWSMTNELMDIYITNVHFDKNIGNKICLDRMFELRQLRVIILKITSQYFITS